MKNIVIRVGDYVKWFLIPDNYPKNQFDALVNLPCDTDEKHMDLWKRWILSIGGEYSGPRTLIEFHGADGRHANIKIDGDRVYVFNDLGPKTVFYANGQWCEVFNFAPEKLAWVDWLMSEPRVVLGRRWENFQKATGALPYIEHASDPEPTTYVFQDVTPVGFILSPGVR